VPNKGPDVLLQSAPRVLERHPEARFSFVGEGPMAGRLAKQTRALGIEQAVRFEGLRHDVDELMRQASLFVRPSYLEGMPLTVLEAMASGLPVVATPVGGTPEIVSDEDTGYLVSVGDRDALAGAISSLLDDPVGTARMGARGRQIVETGYSWDRAVERTEAVYREVIGR